MTNQSPLPSDVRVLFSLKRRKRKIFKEQRKETCLFMLFFFLLHGTKSQPPPHTRQGGGVNLQNYMPLFEDFSFFDPPSFSQNLIYQNIFIPGYRIGRIVNSYTRYFLQFCENLKSEIIFLNFNSDGQFR